MRLPGGEALEARVGLHTGIAVDGLVGRGNTVHYKHATLLHLFSAVATLCHLLWGSAVKTFLSPASEVHVPTAKSSLAWAGSIPDGDLPDAQACGQVIQWLPCSAGWPAQDSR